MVGTGQEMGMEKSSSRSGKSQGISLIILLHEKFL